MDQRKDELLFENIKERKGDLGDGQRVSQVRQGVEDDFHIKTKADEYLLVKKLEAEVKEKNKPSPATTSAFREILQHQGKIQDGRGGGKPNFESQ